MSLLCGANEMQRTGGSLIHMAALKYIPNSPLVSGRSYVSVKYNMR